MIIVWGRRVHAAYERDREALCGRCLQKTTQMVLSLEQRSHIYFIEFGAGTDLGRIARCTRCNNVVPILARTEDAPKRTKAERWMDAFLDAHLLELERADKSTAVGVALVLSVMAGLVVVGWVGVTFNTTAMGIVAVLLLVAGAFAYERAKREIGDAVFARSIRARLATMREKVEVTPKDLAARARSHGYARLAQHFELPRYAPPKVRSDAGPYRSPPPSAD